MDTSGPRRESRDVFAGVLSFCALGPVAPGWRALRKRAVGPVVDTLRIRQLARLHGDVHAASRRGAAGAARLGRGLA